MKLAPPAPQAASSEFRRPRSGADFRAFSLVEVVLALGVLVAGILAILALFPVGLKQNQEAGEQIEAAGLLSTVLADLRNTEPGASESRLFAIRPLPLALENGRVVPNPALQVPEGAASFDSDASNVAKIFVNRSGVPVATPMGDDLRVTVRYTRVPGGGSAVSSAAPTNPGAGIPVPVEAHVMVTWPAVLDPLDPQERGNLGAYLEVYTTFPF